MNFIDKMVEQFIKLNRRMKRWQRLVSVMAAIVVFATTYGLVLPAITLDKDTATTQAGIDVAASENEPDETGTVFESEQEEEEPAAEEAEEEPEEAIAEEDSSSQSGSQEAEADEAEAAEAAEVDETEADGAAAVETEAAEDSSISETQPADEIEQTDALTAEETAAEGTTEEATAAVTEQPAEEVKLIIEDTQLTYETDDYIVYADFGESAKLPEGVQLKVEEITQESDPEAYEVYYQKALSEMQDKYDEKTTLSFAKFYDIAFVYEGVEVEPEGNISVRIEYKQAVEIGKTTTVDTVHFDKNDEEKVEVINSDTEGSEKAVEAVEFESDQFSVYGVVGSETITGDIITAAGKIYTVTVSYNEDAKIPAGAKLKLGELSEGSEKYQQALDAIVAEAEKAYNEGVESDPEAEAFNAEAFKKSLGLDVLDISIVDSEGNEIEPSASVKVTIERKTLPDEITAEAFENIAEVKHLNESTGTPVLETVAAAGTIVVKEGAVKAEFETESFSTYTINWSTNAITVHFVDRNGNELTGVENANGTVIDGGSFTLDSSTTPIDLSTFKKDGYTYSNTRMNHWGDQGIIIYPTIRYNNGNAQHLNDVTQENQSWGNGRTENFADDTEVYVILDPVPSGSGGGGGGVTPIDDLPDPENSKTLTPNHDGTYDLNLSITGHADTEQENKKINVLFIIDNSSSMGYAASDGRTRLINTQEAVIDSARTLLSNNLPSDPDLVEVAAISFDSDENFVVGWTNQLATFTSAINDISLGHGTNWEDGLRGALNFGSGDGDPTYIIFFTDGMPYGYNGYPSRGGDASIYRGDSAQYPSMTAAKDEARAIINSGFPLYSIFAYGTDDDYSLDYLGRLTNYAYDDDGAKNNYYYAAADKDDVIDALASIVDSITQAAGFDQVKITDGMTALTQSTILHGETKPGDFTYYRKGGKNEDGSEKYDSSANQGRGEEWTDAPPAAYDSATGVTWDLSSIGMLEDGVTYTVSFTVWPDQQAYDTVADINNATDPVAAYNALPQSIKDQIQFDTNTKSCALKTNTEAKAEYTTVKTSTQKKLPQGAVQEGDTWKYTDDSGNVWTYVKNEDGTYTGTTSKSKSLTYDDVPALPLEKTTMKVRKVWHDELTGGEDRPDYIDFTIYQDGVEHEHLRLSGESNIWEAEINIAPGIYVTPGTHGTSTEGDNAGVIEGAEGHVYSIFETESDNHYEFESTPVQPMLDGRTTDSDDDMVEFLTMAEWDPTNDALTATNTVKDGIYIYKKVTTNGTDEIDCDEQFTFRITLRDSEGNPVYTTEQKSGELAWRVDKYDEGGSPDPYAEDSRGYYTSTDGIVTLTMDASGRIRIVNVPAGTTFLVEEITTEDVMPAAYEYYSSQVNDNTPTTDNRATDTTVGNKQWAVTVTNKRVALNVNLLKVDNADPNKVLEGAEFSLFMADGETPATDAKGRPIGTITSDADGKATIGSLLQGTYVLEETKAPEGYKKMTSVVTITVGQSNVQAIQGTTPCPVVASEDGLTYTITVTNSEGVELPFTGGPGTFIYTLGGFALIMASALMYGFRMRRRERRFM